MTRLVVHTAGGALQPIEDDVLVQARGHPLGQLQPAWVLGVELGARHLVLEGDDLVQSLDLHQPERGGELAHAKVQSRDVVGRLAVVAIRACMLDELGPA